MAGRPVQGRHAIVCQVVGLAVWRKGSALRATGGKASAGSDHQVIRGGIDLQRDAARLRDSAGNVAECNRVAVRARSKGRRGRADADIDIGRTAAGQHAAGR